MRFNAVIILLVLFSISLCDPVFKVVRVKAGDSAVLKVDLPKSGKVTTWKRIRQGKTVIEEHVKYCENSKERPLECDLFVGKDGKVVPPESIPVVFFPEDGELGIGPVKTSDFGVYWSPQLNPVSPAERGLNWDPNDIWLIVD
ncbi:unnamed protein product [Strongylus vulgaris]|uniref:Uncharacterized protein n=1 Tax=Strongylus vulgaris TaxID=40348 RepID=A0A3P7JMY2_STRVU|nr:unnamed protein product [Strongylus vulgaris]